MNYINIWFSDVSASYQLGFQDPATTSMEGIFLFHLHLLFVTISVGIVVAWLLYSILMNFLEFDHSQVTAFIYSNVIKIVPALILLSLASPSFFLLYSLDEISNPELTLKILDHQLYWSYGLNVFLSLKKKIQNAYVYFLYETFIVKSSYSSYLVISISIFLLVLSNYSFVETASLEALFLFGLKLILGYIFLFVCFSFPYILFLPGDNSFMDRFLNQNELPQSKVLIENKIFKL